MNQPHRQLEVRELDRRDLLRGLALFLGAHSVGGFILGLGGCNSAPSDPQVHKWSGSGSVLYQAWTPPTEMVELGRVILSSFDQLNPLIHTLVTALKPHLPTSAQLSQNANQDSSQEITQSLAQRIQQLHLEATREGRWAEVQGWRLSEVEVAAYALVALKAEV